MASLFTIKFCTTLRFCASLNNHRSSHCWFSSYASKVCEEDTALLVILFWSIDRMWEQKTKMLPIRTVTTLMTIQRGLSKQTACFETSVSDNGNNAFEVAEDKRAAGIRIRKCELNVGGDTKNRHVNWRQRPILHNPRVGGRRRKGCVGTGDVVWLGGEMVETARTTRLDKWEYNSLGWGLW